MPRRKNKSDDAEEDDNVYYGNDEQFQDEENGDDDYGSPVPEEAPRREFKYSTANLTEEGRWKKYCKIFLIFALFMAAMIGLSMLMQFIFFKDMSDNAPIEYERDPLSAFPEDKYKVDQACSTGTIASDGGRRCADMCQPQFFECCDPFNEFDLYGTKSAPTAAPSVARSVALNITETQTSSPTTAPTFFVNQTERAALGNCSLDANVRGCVSYAKCQALGKQFDPAPGPLAEYCSEHQLAQGGETCRDLCKLVKCCYSDGDDNCLADNFDICMDYAPCQNLRDGINLPAAPLDLDRQCLYQTPDCRQACEKAQCCGDPNSLCLRQNFAACLTYAPCSEATRTTITIHPQFNHLPPPPKTLPLACREYHDSLPRNQPDLNAATPKESCQELCAKASCCWASDKSKNCFFKDPLGCTAWEQQCQVVKGTTIN